MRFLLTTLLILFSFSLYSQNEDYWVPTNGPRGSSIVNDLVDFNGTVYAATGGQTLSGAIYRLMGNEWRLYSDGIPVTTSVGVLTVHNNELYAGTHLGGVFKLHNGFWDEVNNGIKTNEVVTVNGINHLISHNNELYMGAINGLYKLDDNETWQKINPDQGSFQRVDELTIIDNKMMIGAFIPFSNNSTIFSYDLEREELTSLFPDFVAQDQMVTSIVKYNDSLFVFATNKTYKSGDLENWEEIPNDASYVTDYFFLDDELYIVSYSWGIFKYNNGAFENVLELEGFAYTIHSVLKRNNDILLGKAFRGVTRTDHNFSSEVEYNQGMNNLGVADLTVNNDYLFAAEVEGDYGWLWRSSDGGENWERLTEGLDAAGYQAIVCSNDTIVSSGANGGTYISTDNGTSFVRKSLLGSGLSGIYINNGRIITSKAINQPIIYSDDLGETIHEIESLPQTNAVSINGKGDLIYMSTRIEGIFRSTDNGENWEAVNDGLPENSGFYNLNSVYTDGITALAVDNQRIYKLNNDTWEIVFETEFNNKMKDVFIEGSFGLCMTTNSMHYTFDGGDTWGNSFYGFYRDFPVQSYAVDENYYYLATHGLGVWRLSKKALSIFDEKIISKEVYPNPANSDLRIDIEVKGKLNVQIYNMNGDNIQAQYSSDNNGLKINVSELTRGVYLLKVNNGSETYGAIFIKD